MHYWHRILVIVFFLQMASISSDLSVTWLFQVINLQKNSRHIPGSRVQIPSRAVIGIRQGMPRFRLNQNPSILIRRVVPSWRFGTTLDVNCSGIQAAHCPRRSLSEPWPPRKSNCANNWLSAAASRARLWLAAVDCSTMAAF